MVFPVTLNYFDISKTYELTNPNWYEHVVPAGSTEAKIAIIQWLYDNVDNPEKHCRWCSFKYSVRVKFRYEKNFIWFRLRF